MDIFSLLDIVSFKYSYVDSGVYIMEKRKDGDWGWVGYSKGGGGGLNDKNAQYVTCAYYLIFL